MIVFDRKLLEKLPPLLGTKKTKKTSLHLTSVMLSSSRKKAPNNSIRFEIKPKSVYISHDERFDENSISTIQKKLLLIAGISAKI